MSTSRFAYKELPKFEPRYYRQWARIVKDAFAEWDWNDYLITPAPVAVPSSKVRQPTTYIIFAPDASISAVPRRSSLNRLSSDINPLLRPVKLPPKSGQYSSRDMANNLKMTN